MSATLDRMVHLSPERAERLERLAVERQISEDLLIANALDLLFGLSQEGTDEEEIKHWSSLGQSVLQRVWDNDEDAIYDNWREIYGVPEG